MQRREAVRRSAPPGALRMGFRALPRAAAWGASDAAALRTSRGKVAQTRTNGRSVIPASAVDATCTLASDGTIAGLLRAGGDPRVECTGVLAATTISLVGECQLIPSR